MRSYLQGKDYNEESDIVVEKGDWGFYTKGKVMERIVGERKMVGKRNGVMGTIA